MTASSATSNDRPEEKNDTVPMMDAEKHPVKDDLPSDSPDAQPPRTHQAAEWNSPEDAGSPLNWSMAKKAYHAAIPSVHCFTVYVEKHCSSEEKKAMLMRSVKHLRFVSLHPWRAQGARAISRLDHCSSLTVVSLHPRHCLWSNDCGSLE